MLTINRKIPARIYEDIQSVINKPYQGITATGIYEACPAGTYIIFFCSDGAKRVVDAWKPDNCHSKVNLRQKTLEYVYPNLECYKLDEYNECLSCLSDSDFIQYLNTIKNRWENE